MRGCEKDAHKTKLGVKSVGPVSAKVTEPTVFLSILKALDTFQHEHINPTTLSLVRVLFVYSHLVMSESTILRRHHFNVMHAMSSTGLSDITAGLASLCALSFKWIR